MTAKNRKLLKSLITTSALVLLWLGQHNGLAGHPEGAQPSIAGRGAGAASDGTAVYNAKCAICHGKDGRGTATWKAKGQPDFTVPGWHKSRTNGQIAEAIRNGKGKFMPAWKGKLSEEEIEALVGTVRAFGRK